MDAVHWICRGPGATPEGWAALRAAWPDADLCLAEDGSHWRLQSLPDPSPGSAARAGAVQPLPALPGAECFVLDPLVQVDGAAAGRPAPWHYVVETDVLPAMEEEFNAWYDLEHLPGLAAVPGVVRAWRLRRRDGRPVYHACYDLAEREALGSAPWLAVRGTPWSTRVRGAFRDTRRVLYRRPETLRPPPEPPTRGNRRPGA